METLSSILQQFGKAGNIGALFASPLGLFEFIEKMSSTQARADFTRYLKSTHVTEIVVHLPNDTRPLFECVFGARHFSWRCVRASVLFSLAVAAGLFALFILNDLKQFVAFFRSTWEQGISPGDQTFLSMIGAWVIWSLVPDYFNLLKTRKVLAVITAREIDRLSVLACILFADFIVGIAIFLLTFGPIAIFGGALLHGTANLGIAFDKYIETSRLFNVFSEPFFWASMVPSIWLWLYVAATLIVRLAVRTAPAFRFSMYLFDIDQHPIRSVGIVAAVLVSSAYAMLLAIWKFAEVLSEAT
jgi:hypothetical protein